MKRFGKMLVMLFCVLGLVIFFGCSAFQDIVIPTHIDENAISYSGQEATSYVPWTTLFDAKRIESYVNFNHLNTQAVYQNLLEQDNRDYSFYIDSVATSIANANDFKHKVFDPSGPIGAMIPLLFGGTIGAMFINTPKKGKSNEPK